MLLNQNMLARDLEGIKQALARIEAEIARLKANIPVMEASQQADSMNASLLKRPVLSRKK